MIVSAALVLWLVRAFDFSKLAGALARADYRYLLPLPVLILGNFVLRAMRWQGLFIGVVPRLGPAFSAMMMGYLFNNVMPARAGELVRLFVLSRGEKLAKSVVLATMIVERAADLLIMVALLVFTLARLPVSGWVRNAGYTVGLIAITSFTAIVAARFARARMGPIMRPVLRFLPTSTMQRIDAAMQGFINGSSALFRWRSALCFLALSVVIWALELALVALIALAFGIVLRPVAMLFVMLAIATGTMVPSSPGYVGTFEFFGISALGMVGVGGAAALAFVLTLHAVTFLSGSLIGAACLAPIGFGRVAMSVGALAAESPADSGAEATKA